MVDLEPSDFISNDTSITDPGIDLGTVSSAYVLPVPEQPYLVLTVVDFTLRILLVSTATVVVPERRPAPLVGDT